jgi:TrmH family RNA methyltransferase
MPKTSRIHSENNDFQYLDALRRNREKRHRSREFLVEGVRLINQALAVHWPINAFLYSFEKHLSDWAQNILNQSSAQTHFELPLPLLAKLSGKEETSELIAVASMPEDRLSRIPLGADLRIVIFDRPSSPGNLGTIIRSADAFGVDGIVITGHAVDLYDPETLSATAGSFFALPVVRIPSMKELSAWLETVQQTIDGVTIVGSSAKTTQDMSTHDFTRPTILVVGNETWGMSARFREICDAIVRIPIGGSATSLNVASATSILLYELDRQRRAAR